MSRMGLPDSPKLLSPLTSTQEGTKLILECGFADHTRVSWQRNGLPVFSGKVSHFKEVSIPGHTDQAQRYLELYEECLCDVSITQTRTKCVLTVHRAGKDHSGEYCCTAANQQGKTITKCMVSVASAFDGKRIVGAPNIVQAKKFEERSKSFRAESTSNGQTHTSEDDKIAKKAAALALLSTQLQVAQRKEQNLQMATPTSSAVKNEQASITLTTRAGVFGPSISGRAHGSFAPKAEIPSQPLPTRASLRSTPTRRSPVESPMHSTPNGSSLRSASTEQLPEEKPAQTLSGRSSLRSTPTKQLSTDSSDNKPNWSPANTRAASSTLLAAKASLQSSSSSDSIAKPTHEVPTSLMQIDSKPMPSSTVRNWPPTKHKIEEIPTQHTVSLKKLVNQEKTKPDFEPVTMKFSTGKVSGGAPSKMQPKHSDSASSQEVTSVTTITPKIPTVKQDDCFRTDRIPKQPSRENSIDEISENMVLKKLSKQSSRESTSSSRSSPIWPPAAVETSIAAAKTSEQMSTKPLIERTPGSGKIEMRTETSSSQTQAPPKSEANLPVKRLAGGGSSIRDRLAKFDSVEAKQPPTKLNVMQTESKPAEPEQLELNAPEQPAVKPVTERKPEQSLVEQMKSNLTDTSKGEPPKKVSPPSSFTSHSEFDYHDTHSSDQDIYCSSDSLHTALQTASVYSGTSDSYHSLVSICTTSSHTYNRSSSEERERGDDTSSYVSNSSSFQEEELPPAESTIVDCEIVGTVPPGSFSFATIVPVAFEGPSVQERPPGDISVLVPGVEYHSITARSTSVQDSHNSKLDSPIITHQDLIDLTIQRSSDTIDHTHFQPVYSETVHRSYSESNHKQSQDCVYTTAEQSPSIPDKLVTKEEVDVDAQQITLNTDSSSDRQEQHTSAEHTLIELDLSIATQRKHSFSSSDPFCSSTESLPGAMADAETHVATATIQINNNQEKSKPVVYQACEFMVETGGEDEAVVCSQVQVIPAANECEEIVKAVGDLKVADEAPIKAEKKQSKTVAVSSVPDPSPDVSIEPTVRKPGRVSINSSFEEKPGKLNVAPLSPTSTDSPSPAVAQEPAERKPGRVSISSSFEEQPDKLNVTPSSSSTDSPTPSVTSPSSRASGSSGAAKPGPKRRSKGGGLAARLAMFQNTDSDCLPMEFGIHAYTDRDLDEETKKAKTIWVSQEEQRRQKMKAVKAAQNDSSPADQPKVTTQFSSSYQSTLKVDSSLDAYQLSIVRTFDSEASSSFDVWETVSVQSDAHHSFDESDNIYQSFVTDDTDIFHSFDHHRQIDAASSDIIPQDYHSSEEYAKEISAHSDDEDELSSQATPAITPSVSVDSNAIVDSTPVATGSSLCNIDSGDQTSSVEKGATEEYENLEHLSLTCDRGSSSTHANITQAARISNFIEQFARSSSESIDSVPNKSLDLHDIADQDTSESNCVDVVTLIVPQRPRLLSREGSPRSSFDMYKINEENEEENHSDHSNHESEPNLIVSTSVSEGFTIDNIKVNDAQSPAITGEPSNHTDYGRTLSSASNRIKTVEDSGNSDIDTKSDHHSDCPHISMPAMHSTMQHEIDTNQKQNELPCLSENHDVPSPSHTTFKLADSIHSMDTVNDSTNFGESENKDNSVRAAAQTIKLLYDTGEPSSSSLIDEMSIVQTMLIDFPGAKSINSLQSKAAVAPLPCASSSIETDNAVEPALDEERSCFEDLKAKDVPVAEAFGYKDTASAVTELLSHTAGGSNSPTNLRATSETDNSQGQVIINPDADSYTAIVNCTHAPEKVNTISTTTDTEIQSSEQESEINLERPISSTSVYVRCADTSVSHEQCHDIVPHLPVQRVSVSALSESVSESTAEITQVNQFVTHLAIETELNESINNSLEQQSSISVMCSDKKLSNSPGDVSEPVISQVTPSDSLEDEEIKMEQSAEFSPLVFHNANRAPCTAGIVEVVTVYRAEMVAVPDTMTYQLEVAETQCIKCEATSSQASTSHTNMSFSGIPETPGICTSLSAQKDESDEKYIFEPMACSETMFIPVVPSEAAKRIEVQITPLNSGKESFNTELETASSFASPKGTTVESCVVPTLCCSLITQVESFAKSELITHGHEAVSPTGQEQGEPLSMPIMHEPTLLCNVSGRDYSSIYSEYCDEIWKSQIESIARTELITKELEMALPACVEQDELMTISTIAEPTVHTGPENSVSSVCSIYNDEISISQTESLASEEVITSDLEIVPPIGPEWGNTLAQSILQDPVVFHEVSDNSSFVSVCSDEISTTQTEPVARTELFAGALETVSLAGPQLLTRTDGFHLSLPLLSPTALFESRLTHTEELTQQALVLEVAQKSYAADSIYSPQVEVYVPMVESPQMELIVTHARIMNDVVHSELLLPLDNTTEQKAEITDSGFNVESVESGAILEVFQCQLQNKTLARDSAPSVGHGERSLQENVSSEAVSAIKSESQSTEKTGATLKNQATKIIQSRDMDSACALNSVRELSSVELDVTVKSYLLRDDSRQSVASTSAGELNIPGHSHIENWWNQNIGNQQASPAEQGKFQADIPDLESSDAMDDRIIYSGDGLSELSSHTENAKQSAHQRAASQSTSSEHGTSESINYDNNSQQLTPDSHLQGTSAVTLSSTISQSYHAMLHQAVSSLNKHQESEVSNIVDHTNRRAKSSGVAIADTCLSAVQADREHTATHGEPVSAGAGMFDVNTEIECIELNGTSKNIQKISQAPGSSFKPMFVVNLSLSTFEQSTTESPVINTTNEKPSAMANSNKTSSGNAALIQEGITPPQSSNFKPTFVTDLSMSAFEESTTESSVVDVTNEDSSAMADSDKTTSDRAAPIQEEIVPPPSLNFKPMFVTDLSMSTFKQSMTESSVVDATDEESSSLISSDMASSEHIVSFQDEISSTQSSNFKPMFVTDLSLSAFEESTTESSVVNVTNEDSSAMADSDKTASDRAAPIQEEIVPPQRSNFKPMFATDLSMSTFRQSMTESSVVNDTNEESAALASSDKTSSDHTISFQGEISSTQCSNFKPKFVGDLSMSTFKQSMTESSVVDDTNEESSALASSDKTSYDRAAPIQEEIVPPQRSNFKPMFATDLSMSTFRQSMTESSVVDDTNEESAALASSDKTSSDHTILFQGEISSTQSSNFKPMFVTDLSLSTFEQSTTESSVTDDTNEESSALASSDKTQESSALASSDKTSYDHTVSFQGEISSTQSSNFKPMFVGDLSMYTFKQSMTESSVVDVTNEESSSMANSDKTTSDRAAPIREEFVPPQSSNFKPMFVTDLSMSAFKQSMTESSVVDDTNEESSALTSSDKATSNHIILFQEEITSTRSSNFKPMFVTDLSLSTFEQCTTESSVADDTNEESSALARSDKTTFELDESIQQIDLKMEAASVESTETKEPNAAMSLKKSMFVSQLSISNPELTNRDGNNFIEGGITLSVGDHSATVVDVPAQHGSVHITDNLIICAPDCERTVNSVWQSADESQVTTAQESSQFKPIFVSTLSISTSKLPSVLSTVDIVGNDQFSTAKSHGDDPEKITHTDINMTVEAESKHEEHVDSIKSTETVHRPTQQKSIQEEARDKEIEGHLTLSGVELMATVSPGDITEQSINGKPGRLETATPPENKKPWSLEKKASPHSDSMKYKSLLKSQKSTGEAPQITIRVRNQYCKQGETITLKCRVEGAPKPEISWDKDGKIVTPSTRIVAHEKNGFQYLEISNAVGEDIGRYTVTASNATGKATSSSQVDVTTIPGKPSDKPEKTKIEQKTVTVSDDGTSITKKTVKTTFTTSTASKLVPKKPEPSTTVPKLKPKMNGELKSTKTQSPLNTRQEKTSPYLSKSTIDKQVDDFHKEANEFMSELEALTPRSKAKKTITSVNDSESSAPTFLVKLKDCEVEEGDNVVLECITKGEDLMADHSPPQFVKILQDGEVEEGDSVTIQCRSPHENDHGMKTRAPQFTQKLRDQEVEEGDSVTIECHSPHDNTRAAAPRFVKDLEDEEVEEGDSVIIQCKSPHNASGSGAPVFIQKLEDHDVEEGDSVTIECKSPYSGSSRETSQAPRFTTQLEDQEVEEGDSVTIQCKSPSDHPHSETHLTEYKEVRGHSLTPDTSPKSDKSDSQVRQNNNYLKSSKQSATPVPPRFIQNLKNQEVEEGESLTLSCRNSKDLSNSPVNEKPKFVKQLKTEEVEEGDSLTISCQQKTDHAPSPLPADKNDTACPPTIVQELSDLTVNVGELVELSLVTGGSLPMDIVWVHNEDELAHDDPDYEQFSDGHTHRLIITAAFPEDSGTYIAEAYNDHGDTDTACELIVQENAGEPFDASFVDKKPKFIETLPETVSVCEDATVELKCRIAKAEAIDVTWTKNGRMARRGLRFTLANNGDTFIYTIRDVMSTDKGEYEVCASTEEGTVTSKCALTVTSAPEEKIDPKAIVRHSRLAAHATRLTCPRFSKTLQETTVCEHEQLELACQVEAIPTPTITWKHNGAEIKPNKSFIMSYENGVASLRITETFRADEGRYSVTAKNSEGSDQTGCTVTVTKPVTHPSILPPDAPIGRPYVGEVTSSSATISWHGPAYDGGAVVIGYKVEMCKNTLLSISHDKFWRTLAEQCEGLQYRTNSLTADHEYVFRVRAINSAGEGAPSEWSESIMANDRRMSTRSESTMTDGGESVYSEFYPESEYDPDLDEAFLEHNVVVTKDRKLEDEYNVQEELGRGKFGSVFLVTGKHTNRNWAAKKIKCRPSQKAEIMNEVEIMSELRHTKLVRLWEVFDHGREVVLIQEYVGGGELFERIVDDDFSVTESDCVRFVKQICDGIAYMHSKYIIHLDLKPENVMCVSKHSNQIKLIDFGLARKYKKGDDVKVMFGTPEFVAPEVINYDPVSYATDMWSIGVITYVLLSGLSPFMGDNDPETLSNVTGAQWDFEDEAFDEISQTAKDFITEILIKRVEKRLTSEEALKHAWLKDSGVHGGKHLTKNKDKMKRFIARRKWQKTGKAILAMTRIRGSLSKLRLSPSQEPTTPTEEQVFPAKEAIKEETILSDVLTVETQPLKLSAIREDSIDSDLVNRIHSPSTGHSPPHYESVRAESNMASDSELDSGYSGRKSTDELFTDSECKSMSSMVNSSEDEYDLAQPKFLSELQEITNVIEGDCCRLDVIIQSKPPATVKWYKNSECLTIGGRFDACTDGQKHSLVIRDVRLSDDAEYECRATNEHGEAACFGELYIVTTG